MRTAWISALPANPWGDRVRRELAAHGVDCKYVSSVPGARLGLYFLEYGVAPRSVQVLYDRRDSAFSRLMSDAVDWEPVRRARVAHVTGITPALGSQASKLVYRVFDEATTVSFDINYRASLWSPSEARTFAESVLPRARYIFVGKAEAETVFGLQGHPEEVLNGLARRNPKATIALLQGSDGSTVLDGGRLWRPTVSHAVQIIDPIGAGDAYAAGFLWASLNGQRPQDAVNIAATVAALKCSMWGDFALINPKDVEDALGGGADIRR
jgi:2-dehydro-3-deoxygluconokinase